MKIAFLLCLLGAGSITGPDHAAPGQAIFLGVEPEYVGDQVSFICEPKDQANFQGGVFRDGRGFAVFAATQPGRYFVSFCSMNEALQIHHFCKTITVGAGPPAPPAPPGPGPDPSPNPPSPPDPGRLGLVHWMSEATAALAPEAAIRKREVGAAFRSLASAIRAGTLSGGDLRTYRATRKAYCTACGDQYENGWDDIETRLLAEIKRLNNAGQIRTRDDVIDAYDEIARGCDT